MLVKKVKKGVMLFGCLCMVMVPVTPMVARANSVEQIQPCSECISWYTVNLNISNTGVARVTASVTGKVGIENVYVKATLQKKSDGGWTNVKSWQSTKKGRYASIEETYTVSKGTYRVHATFKADSETKTMLSGTKTY